MCVCVRMYGRQQLPAINGWWTGYHCNVYVRIYTVTGQFTHAKAHVTHTHAHAHTHTHTYTATMCTCHQRLVHRVPLLYMCMYIYVHQYTHTVAGLIAAGIHTNTLP